MLNDPKSIRVRYRALSRKLELFALLGGKCVKCGFTDIRALQIDHIDGGGVIELRKTGNRAHYYKKVIESIKAGNKKYQLLCANCNWIKRWDKEEQ